MIQTQENGKRPHFTPGSVGPFGPNLGLQIFFIIQVVRHCSKLEYHLKGN